MREYRYTTPHGIEVTRSASQGNYQKGLKHLLRDLDRHRGIYLSSGYEYPGRYSRWDIASTCPPLEIVSYDRRVEFRPLNERGAQDSARCSIRCSPRIRTGRNSASNRRRAGRPFEAAARAVSGRGAQQAALRVFHSARADRRVPRRGGFAPRPGGRFRLRPAVPVRAHRKEAAARRPQGPAPVPLRRHLVHGSQEGADRALPLRFRARAAFPRAAWRATPREIAPPPSAPARPHRFRPHAGRVHGQRGEGARRHARAAIITRWCCARPSARPIRARPPSCSSACSTPAPAPTSSSCNSATSSWSARRRRCSCAWKASASRPARLPARRSAPAIRCATPRTSASCSKSTKEESELTMCTDVDRNDKSRVCEPGTVKVIGRRLIESYAGVFHTVDHVEGVPQGGLRFAGRVPQPHVGGDGDRRAQEGRGAGHRSARKGRARLVRRRRGHDLCSTATSTPAS